MNSETTTVADDCFSQVSRAFKKGATGHDALKRLLRLLMTHYDRVDTEGGYTKLHTFGLCISTHFGVFGLGFRALVLKAMGNERI